MADSSHLERMGRELKCPICLSLLNSAMSLTCNHVFCNLCINKSMRSGSSCPVCKVPFQRREIRPAPHMDNLVNIYKGMEVASGLSLFVTQNPLTTISSDAERQVEVDMVQEIGGETPEAVQNQVTKETRTKSLCTKKQKNSGHNRGKPSFLMNKRVQVPQSPITETPVRQAISKPGKRKIINNVSNKNSDSPSEHPPSNGNGNPLLSPFFWLREDVDKLSQQTDVDHLTGTPAKPPSFSDIKDSDDDVHSERSPEVELLRKCNKVDLFDSEMFEWTQRACSPELFSTPIKMQVRDTSKSEGMETEMIDAPSNNDVTNEEIITEFLDRASPLRRNTIKNSKVHNSSSYGSKMPKKIRKVNKITKLMQQRNNVGQAKEAHDGSKSQYGFIQSGGCNPQLAAGSSKVDCDAKAGFIKSIPESPKKVDGFVASKVFTSSYSKKGPSEGMKLKNSKRNFKSVRQSDDVEKAKRKKQKNNLAKPDVTEEIISQDIMSKSKLCVRRSIRKSFSVPGSSTSCSAQYKSKRCCQKMNYGMENGASEDGCQTNVVNGSKYAWLNSAAQAGVNAVQGNPNNDNQIGSSTIGKVPIQKTMAALHKCNASSIICAFCHASEETEASGEMVHYFEGRPILEKHSAGPVIHSHKNCTEWAPNVYFEDDIAVNLEEELARSRRIKCSLCGVKGAALGCYEKSCRKSFHVPCAKLLRECRWDADHFVMLCPLHASSKLSCELSSSEVKKEKSNLKGKFLHRRSQVAVRHGPDTALWTPCRSSEKLVLCCSGLAAPDKETISVFVKSSGVLISTSWNQNVTHVIASVDENGACRRTLKVLMGILEGKWIVSIKWIQACMNAKRLVEETPYEINSDIHGVKNGPRSGRLRLLNKQPKLFAGFKFYFVGDFVPSYKGYLQDLITVAGGSVLHRKPIAETDNIAALNSTIPSAIIVYNIELPDSCNPSKKDMILERRRSDAEALARSSGSRVANNSWVLNCIAGHKLQDL